jgi:hypothetical protein
MYDRPSNQSTEEPMVNVRQAEIESRLLCVLNEIEKQRSVSASYPAGVLPFADEMKQIREYIEVAGEYGVAYEILVATIEVFPFTLSGKVAIALLELGLLLGYKTDRTEDSLFDRRKST